MPRKRLREHRRLAAAGALLLLALLLRIAFIAATPGYVPSHDDRRYARLACSIVEMHVYAVHTPDTTPDGCGPAPSGPNEPTAFRPPAYPLLLGGVLVAADGLHGGFWTAGRLVNAVLGTLAVALIGVIALELWGPRVAVVAMALGAVDLPLVLVGGSLLTEPLFVALVLAATAVALHARRVRRPGWWAALAGALVGLATLTRPTGLVLLVPLALAVAWRPRRPAAALALGLAAAAVIAPWTARNLSRMDAFIPVSGNVGSWLGGTYNAQARADPFHPASSQVRVRADRDLAGLAEQFRQRILMRRALDYAAAHPDYVAVVLLRNTQRMLNLEGSQWWRNQADSISLPRWAADAAAAQFLVLMLLALAGACTAAARGAPRWVWLVPLLLFAAVIVAGSEIRYRAPIEPFVVLLAALVLVGRRAPGDLAPTGRLPSGRP
jgi:4-amino-4-deoxy-L-arabinose transferase-like glycosyltransferase